MQQALYYHSGGVTSSAATCEISNNRLHVSIEARSNISLERCDISVKSKLGDLPREIILPDGDMLVCPSTPALDNWLDKNASSVMHRIESRASWLIGSILLVPVLLYCLFTVLIPYVAVSLAAHLPYGVKQIASEHTLSALDHTVLDTTTLSQEDVKTMRTSFDNVLGQLSTKNPHYRVLFRASETFGPNAFALPDGTIVFTDELVRLVENDQALLNAILLHEVGHVEHEHAMRLVSESLFTTLAISYFFGDLSGALEAFLGVGSTVVQNKFSQAHEWESDNFAIEQLQALGEDPADFASAMRALKSMMPDNSEANSWFQSHPMLEARIQNAERAGKKRNERLAEKVVD